MGKRLIQQRRGRGTKTYTSPSFRFKGAAKHAALETGGVVVDIIHCAGHSAPLMKISYLTGDEGLTFAPKGIKVGDLINVGPGSEVGTGNVLPLSEIPEGTLVHNI